MLKTLARELTTEGLVKHEDAVVVAVSGGPDSMALLHVLIDLNKNGWGLRLHVAHLDHQLRKGDSSADAAFVQAAADGLSLPCTIDSRDTASLAEQDKLGIEEVARRERYAFLGRVCLKVGARLIAVGHQADDNAETILHRVLRGTGLRGLVGIPRRRPLAPSSDIHVIRPLLRVSRSDLLAFLANSGIAYREDRTNASNEPMRNRIRNVILPMLESEVNPQTRDALLRLGEQAQWVEEYLRETVERTFETLIVTHTDQQLVLNADAIARKSRIVQTELVRLAYRSFGLGEQALGFSHMVGALELIADSASGKRVQLPNGMTIEKRYHRLIFTVPTDEPRETIAAEIAVHCPGQTILPRRRLQLDCDISEVSPQEIHQLRHSTDKYEEFVDIDAVHLPLVIRARRPGERFFPLGAPGSKSVSDFLADAKVDPLTRERIAVLCDQLGPIWLIGQRIDDRVKVTELSKRVLHLRARPLNP